MSSSLICKRKESISSFAKAVKRFFKELDYIECDEGKGIPIEIRYIEQGPASSKNWTRITSPLISDENDDFIYHIVDRCKGNSILLKEENDPCNYTVYDTGTLPYTLDEYLVKENINNNYNDSWSSCDKYQGLLCAFKVPREIYGNKEQCPSITFWMTDEYDIDINKKTINVKTLTIMTYGEIAKKLGYKRFRNRYVKVVNDVILYFGLQAFSYMGIRPGIGIYSIYDTSYAWECNHTSGQMMEEVGRRCRIDKQAKVGDDIRIYFNKDTSTKDVLILSDYLRDMFYHSEMPFLEYVKDNRTALEARRAERQFEGWKRKIVGDFEPKSYTYTQEDEFFVLADKRYDELYDYYNRIEQEIGYHQYSKFREELMTKNYEDLQIKLNSFRKENEELLKKQKVIT